MDFLFHTVIEFSGVAVYYSIFRKGEDYYAQILDNPNKVIRAKDFLLVNKKDTWIASESVSVKSQEILVYEIEKFNQARKATKAIKNTTSRG